jgi:hypothetical protein
MEPPTNAAAPSPTRRTVSRSMCLLTSDRGAGAGAPGAVKDETTASVARDSLKSWTPMLAAGDDALRRFWCPTSSRPDCFNARRLWRSSPAPGGGATAAAPEGADHQAYTSRAYTRIAAA